MDRFPIILVAMLALLPLFLQEERKRSFTLRRRLLRPAQRPHSSRFTCDGLVLYTRTNATQPFCARHPHSQFRLLDELWVVEQVMQMLKNNANLKSGTPISFHSDCLSFTILMMQTSLVFERGPALVKQNGQEVGGDYPE